jgi:catechol 2,3-dioxygenase-like lactoylglutathione lyase family enzyme
MTPPPRPAIAQSVTFLYADPPEASWRFYEEVLGLSLVQDQGSCRIYEAASGGLRAFIGVCRARAPRASDNPRVVGGVVFTFVTEDVDGWYAHLKAHGVVIPAPPALSESYRVYHFFLTDPAGYTLEFQRFDRPDWQMPPG